MFVGTLAWPRSLFPKQTTPPDEVSAQLCAEPVATAVTEVRPAGTLVRP
jgi:hypothetical protein